MALKKTRIVSLSDGDVMNDDELLEYVDLWLNEHATFTKWQPKQQLEFDL